MRNKNTIVALRKNGSTTRRSGLTLVELIVASTIMALIVGAMAALAMTVEAGGEHGRELSTTLQHAEVVTERIERTLLDAHTSNSFPGFVVFSETESGFDFPDTLVVWSPADKPADPEGSPRFDELVVFTPDPDDPSRLLEITARTFPVATPALDDLSAWQAALATMRTSDTVERGALTNRLRTSTTSGAVDAVTRTAIRFDVRLSPSDDELATYPAVVGWDELPWALGMFSSDSGQRQAWCRFEMQLMTAADNQTSSDAALPFFGSSAVYYQWRQ